LNRKEGKFAHPRTIKITPHRKIKRWEAYPKCKKNAKK